MVVVALSTVAAILATVGVDRIAGVVVTDPLRTSGLIFHPHSTATYRTPEFTFTASTNALGFRDHEFTQGRSPACRVLAIGDSFTFGWGVSLEESWPKVLETTLKQAASGSRSRIWDSRGADRRRTSLRVGLHSHPSWSSMGLSCRATT